jgi:hypothetical protein
MKYRDLIYKAKKKRIKKQVLPLADGEQQAFVLALALK